MGDETGPAIASRHVSRGCAFGDFDNDGDLDILIMNRNEPPTLLRNDAPPNNHWIKVRLEGAGTSAKSNRSAIGCPSAGALRRKSAGASVDQPVQLSVGQRPASALRLGRASKASVEIHWPTRRFGNLRRLGSRSVGHHSRGSGNRERTALSLGYVVLPSVLGRARMCRLGNFLKVLYVRSYKDLAGRGGSCREAVGIGQTVPGL